MYVCICKQITDKEVRAAINDGLTDLDALSSHLGLGTSCGCCVDYTSQILHEHSTVAEPILYGD